MYNDGCDWSGWYSPVEWWVDWSQWSRRSDESCGSSQQWSWYRDCWWRGMSQHHTLSELVQQCLIVPDNIASVYMHTFETKWLVYTLQVCIYRAKPYMWWVYGTPNTVWCCVMMIKLRCADVCTFLLLHTSSIHQLLWTRPAGEVTSR